MSFKTILIHVDGGPCQESRLRAAAVLATANGAHLVGSAATAVAYSSHVILNGPTWRTAWRTMARRARTICRRPHTFPTDRSLTTHLPR